MFAKNHIYSLCFCSNSGTFQKKKKKKHQSVHALVDTGWAEQEGDKMRNPLPQQVCRMWAALGTARTSGD